MRPGPPVGVRYCDFSETLRFLTMVKKRQPITMYGMYHQTEWRADTKKLYRYLRYAIKLDLMVLDHTDETLFLPAKYYRLTTAGEDLMKWAATHIPNVILGS